MSTTTSPDFNIPSEPSWESVGITREEFIKFYNESGHYILFWKNYRVNRLSIDGSRENVIIQIDANLTGVFSLNDFLLKDISMYLLVNQDEKIVEEMKRFFQKPDAKWE